MRFRLTKGFDIPLTGAPRGDPGPLSAATRVALLGRDYGYPRVSLEVGEGDGVREGSTLFTDRPVEISRLASLSRGEIRERMLAAGLWTAFRARPYERIPPPSITPRAIFVTAIDTNPLAPDPVIAIDAAPAAFEAGLRLISRLCDGLTYLCLSANRTIPAPDVEKVEVVQFAGPHPAGLPGTHIHALVRTPESRAHCRHRRAGLAGAPAGQGPDRRRAVVTLRRRAPAGA